MKNQYSPKENSFHYQKNCQEKTSHIWRNKNNPIIMTLKPPHLETEEDRISEEPYGNKFSKIGPQGPSKYGK
jgi:hypothetical protein